MKEYLRQFYNEGLATTFYIKPINFFKKKIKNKEIVKLLSLIIKIVYTILALSFGGYIFYKKFHW